MICVTQAGLEFTVVILPQSPQRWDYSNVAPNAECSCLYFVVCTSVWACEWVWGTGTYAMSMGRDQAAPGLLHHSTVFPWTVSLPASEARLLASNPSDPLSPSPTALSLQACNYLYLALFKCGRWDPNMDPHSCTENGHICQANSLFSSWSSYAHCFKVKKW